jgi:hypothetical protein
MRNACKPFTRTALALALFASCAALARAQGRDARLVSARAGAVNYTAGDVTVRRSGQQSWQTLLRTDDLRAGDAVRTGADGRAEILLNPGSYLRLGENTELVMTDTSLDTLRLKLARGSALVEAAVVGVGSTPAVGDSQRPRGTVIEAAARSAAGFVILIDTPRTQALVVRSGIYRVNVAPDGATEFLVRKGRALVGPDALTVREGGVASNAAGGAVEVAKFDKDQKDDLDAWSKRRAEEMARANSRLQRRTVNTALAGMSWNNFGWGSTALSGLWYFNAVAGCYTYLPFFGWSSPYGFDYFTAAPGLAGYCHCGYNYRDAWRPSGVVGNGGNVTGGGTTTGGGWTNSHGDGGSTTGGGGMVVRSPGDGPGLTRTPSEMPVSSAPHADGAQIRRDNMQRRNDQE